MVNDRQFVNISDLKEELTDTILYQQKHTTACHCNRDTPRIENRQFVSSQTRSEDTVDLGITELEISRIEILRGILH